jgi:hypothetical protein
MKPEEQAVFDEFKKRPGLAHAANLCIFAVIAGVLIDTVFKDKFDTLISRYATLVLIHAGGCIAGAWAIASSPDSLKKRNKKNLTLPVIINGGFALWIGFRLVKLMTM